jgi:uncharacterized protein (UPF0297 family)
MNNNLTMKFTFEQQQAEERKEIISFVYNALKEKGYHPINQMTGYLLSGDPTYITTHKDARKLIKKVERDEIIEELLKSYIEKEL